MNGRKHPNRSAFISWYDIRVNLAGKVEDEFASRMPFSSPPSRQTSERLAEDAWTMDGTNIGALLLPNPTVCHVDWPMIPGERAS